MSRRSRLHVPGGLYYVVQRGNSGQPIFRDVEDYASLEELLAATLRRCHAQVHAFCWQPSAIHLVAQIAEVPLGEFMQRLTSQYARRLHRRYGHSGHLFGQRYHAVLVDPQAYFLKLIRYIHRIAVSAGEVDAQAQRSPSSHRAYLGATTLPWLTVSLAQRALVARGDSAHLAYRRLMSESTDSRDEEGFLRGVSEDPRILGGQEFISTMPRHQRRYRSTHSLEQVIDTVAYTLALDREMLLSRSRRRHLALARALITWSATERRIATLAEVARRLDRDPSTLVVAVERYRLERPELFDFATLRDAGPLLPMRVRTAADSVDT